ncbi:hypothetical protein C8J55DRAFT_245045 [Lentinula edodes]|uniref:Uncharacterized protein n=1 Tax=Lentinula lateritia TaxID=40482 RepID=A0A9W8ZT22_9AGAR|nr:hypothetical protein C8J55DRAFT_245045 [Lentinula edodes]
MYFCSALTAVITLGAVHSALALPVQGPPGFGPWDGAVGVPVVPGIPIPPANIPGPPLHGDEQVLVTVEENLSHLSAHQAYHPNDGQYTPLIPAPVEVGPIHAGTEKLEDQPLSEKARVTLAFDVENRSVGDLIRRDTPPPGPVRHEQLHARGLTKIRAIFTTTIGCTSNLKVQLAAKQSVIDLLDAKKSELNIAGDLKVTVEGIFKSDAYIPKDVPFKFFYDGKEYTGVARGQGQGEITRIQRP